MRLQDTTFSFSSARSIVPIHTGFWGATFIFFVLFFGREAGSYAESVLFVALLLPVAMATTYFATGFLVPRFLLPGRYGLFALYSTYALVGSVYLELVVLVTSFVLLAGYDMRAMIPPALDLFGLVVALYVVVFLAVAADLAMRWHRLRAEHDRTARARLQAELALREAERARLEAELALREAELARLQTQMQPHFLFNTLNNLYGLTLERSDDAPEVVLRISEMLDYILYRCSRSLVPLADELAHLTTYLDLERLRHDERVKISLKAPNDLPEGCIAPLLLTPFVENSFKHGAARSSGPASVDIQISCEGDRLQFSVANTKGSVEHCAASPGIGLENVKRRLNLLYPDEHELLIDDGPDRYTVRLSIPIHTRDAFVRTEVGA